MSVILYQRKIYKAPTTLTATKSVKKSLPWWIRLLIDVGLYGILDFLPFGEFISTAIETAVILTVDTTLDVLEGDDATTIATNVAFTLFPFISKLGKLRALKYSSNQSKTVRNLLIDGVKDDDKKILKTLDKDITQNIAKRSTRNYRTAEAKLSEILKAKKLTFALSKEQGALRYNKLKLVLQRFNKFTRTSNRVLATIVRPQYAIRRLSAKFFKRRFAVINKYILGTKRKALDAIKGFIKIENKALRHGEMIPFVSQWIKGAKVFESPFGKEHVTAIVYFFDPTRPANKQKEPVVLFNTPLAKFVEFCKASSKGHYYLYQYSYGWGTIAKLFKSAKLGGFNQVASLMPLLTGFISPVVTTASTWMRFIKQIQDLDTLKKNWDITKWAFWEESFKEVGYSALGSIRGANWLKRMGQAVIKQDKRTLLHQAYFSIHKYTHKRKRLRMSSKIKVRNRIHA